MDNKKFLTVAEVAAEFGVDETALQGFVDSGEVRALADRGTWKYRRDELQALLDAGKVAPPNAEIWLDDASSNDEILNVGADADDELSYIELDEDALAEHATMITKKSPFEDRTPVDEMSNPEDWFAPSDAREMSSEVTDPSQSASDIRIYTGELDPDVARSLQSSDSDVRLADDAILSDNVLDWDESAKKGNRSDVGLSGVATRSNRTDSDSDVRIAPRMLDSDSDIRIASSKPASDSDVRIATDSDSDVKIADSEPVAVSDNSGIVLDFDFGAGATVSASGSSLRLPQTAGMNEPFSDQDGDEIEQGSGIWSGSGALSGLGDDSDVALSGVASDSDSGSALRLGADDSGISLFGLDASGIALDGGSHLGIPGAGSSVLLDGPGSTLGGLSDDSGVSLAPAGDSGLALESPLADSGIALQAGSAASVMDDESGITLGMDDSGLSLEADDSGLSLESSGDSGISLSSPDKTLSEGDFTSSLFDGDNDAGRTQTLDISNEFDDDSSFDMNLSDVEQTAEFQIGDEDDVEETAATVVKKGRNKKDGPGLTEAFKLDDSLEVEDLDIADELEAGVDAEDDEVAEIEEDEVFDASEETFSDEVDAVEDDDGEGYITAAAGAAAAAKALGPREPSWGMGMSVGLIAGSLFLAANGMIMWAGVSSMWDGADPTGPAASLIAQLAGMF